MQSDGLVLQILDWTLKYALELGIEVRTIRINLYVPATIWALTNSMYSSTEAGRIFSRRSFLSDASAAYTSASVPAVAAASEPKAYWGTNHKSQ